MEDNYLYLTALVAAVIISAMFFSKVRQFSVADVDAGAAVGPWVSLWIKGKNTKGDALPSEKPTSQKSINER